MDTVYGEQEVMRVAQTILGDISPRESGATIIGLSGELGAGKTTLVKSMASLLGSRETVVSPTFVIAKWYDTPDARWRQLVHMDAYRIEDDAELDPLGWDTLLQDPRTLLVIEWPERIIRRLPAHATRFSIDHTHDARHIRRLTDL